MIKNIIILIMLLVLSYFVLERASFIKKDPVVTEEPVEENPDDMMSLTVYLQDKEVARTTDCGVTQPILYQVAQTTGVADASLKILFEEELARYGVYESVKISDAVAQVLLVSSQTPEGGSISGLSSCEAGHLMSVLTDTLTQYDEIKSVELYSPEGKVEF